MPRLIWTTMAETAKICKNGRSVLIWPKAKVINLWCCKMVSSRFFDLLNYWSIDLLIYDLKRSVYLRWLFHLLLHSSLDDLVLVEINIRCPCQSLTVNLNVTIRVSQFVRNSVTKSLHHQISPDVFAFVSSSFWSIVRKVTCVDDSSVVLWRRWNQKIATPTQMSLRNKKII